ncbi:hypothetical protein BWQ96_05805 [Gracilariopsis chorda]|uniref:Uncharacterized protein n=1 Tax=Gracilariopsis chorda TaxID=448386 RepID=A0A2V3IQP5_9FLOR|nr:hypothetical protein BWQ96_05805 [Gracilariopsis chorda]|eukprot:PXF44435.1 hypothetical protein BWQ96_05805 [Gracilariopsis chorda]
MERYGYIKPIQGGGDGIGFQTPRQVIELESTKGFEISRKILNQSCASSNKNDERMEVWKKELEHRLFLIHQRRLENNRTDCSNLQQKRQSEERFTVADNQVTNEMSSLSKIQQNALACNNRSSTENEFQFRTSSISSSGELKADQKLKAFVRFIPWMPKTAEEAIEIWRKGSSDRGYKAVRLFGNAANRRKFIVGYEDWMWSKTGQKNLFLRYRALIELISEFGLVTLRINEEETTERWKAAIDGFNQHFRLRERPQSISAILKSR